MKRTGFLLVVVSAPALAFAVAYGEHRSSAVDVASVNFIFTVVLVALLISTIRDVSQWSKAVALRFGNIRSNQSLRIFFTIPHAEPMFYWIETHVLAYAFKFEKTCTTDELPVHADAILFGRSLKVREAVTFRQFESEVESIERPHEP
jgi:regulator of protease activity HflC (stomatin/prohibitin superfamily)